MSKINKSIAVFSLFIAAITAGCSYDSSSDSIGGGGADFDPALYYTKSEINNLLPTVAYENPKDLANTMTDYDNGVQFTQPANKNFVMLFVRNKDSSNPVSQDITLFAGTNSSTVSPGIFPANFLGSQLYGIRVSGTDFKFWATGWGADFDEQLSIIPLWLSDPSYK